MEKDTYESLDAELHRIEEENDSYQRAMGKIKCLEEEVEFKAQSSLHGNSKCLPYWQDDRVVRQLLDEQQSGLRAIQTGHHRLVKERMEQSKIARRFFTEREEDCYVRKRKLNQDHE